MASLSPEEYIAQLQEKLEGLKTENKPFEIAVRDVLAKIPTRIFSEGKNSQGSDIGTYKNYELYVSDEKLARAGTHRGKTGKPTKTSYYQSYAKLKQQQGFDSKVNWRLTNELQSDLSNAAIQKGSTATPPIEPDKISPNEYHVTLKKEINIKKFKGLTQRYGEVVTPTQEEQDHMDKVLDFELEKYMNA